jgi:hypothetical protein
VVKCLVVNVFVGILFLNSLSVIHFLFLFLHLFHNGHKVCIYICMCFFSILNFPSSFFILFWFLINATSFCFYFC